ncbi:ACP S-malonyltransferase [Actinoplanes sp. N902-109]|uniref:ACP S-malonyltransferase n=1 Tax=Actinoplanes sp. (strain N902-109) TaxID=649831 RepID=UPI0003295080|nr:ACP S-malonyltransferase [Actinoplanes sp. N902-109]AGL13748.1 malonyl CoA-acyl carrier protein transacylase [Actinoplanes sp. N902-109]
MNAGPNRAWMFPGQGAQAKGMGAKLFDRFPALVAEADELLGYSIVEKCLADPRTDLRSTRHAQPALYVVEALAVLAEREDTGTEPAFLLGHSVGEYAALFAAGVFDFSSGLRLIRARAEAMAELGAEGTMVALLGVDPSDVTALLDRHGLTGLDVALHNAPGQVAVAGPLQTTGCLLELAVDAGLKAVPLNVSGPFHSRYMQDAADRFAGAVAEVTLHPPRVPVLANVTARPYEDHAIAETLIRQLTHPVLWCESVVWLLDRGPVEFTELGPGTTLTGMVRRIRAYAQQPVNLGRNQ